MSKKKPDVDFYKRMLEAKARKKMALEQKRLKDEFRVKPEEYLPIKTEAEQKLDQAFEQIKAKYSPQQQAIRNEFDKLKNNLLLRVNMAWITQRLGNGFWGTVDAENPSQPPAVTVTTTSSSQTFSRILTEQANDDEEIRREVPTDYDSGFEYVGFGPFGASTASPVWNIVRATWVDKHKTRLQFQNDIAWDDKHLGW